MKPTIELPKLDKGEVWLGGIILPDHTTRHTILLPGEHKGLDFDAAQVWCAEQGGSAPECIEQALAFKFHQQEFRPVAYWSCEQSARLSSWAWFQHFDYGDQDIDNKSSKLAVRAVRRVIV
jgi:hypothetical protein